MNTRKLVFEELERAFSERKYANLALDGALSKADLAPAERKLFTFLFYGVLEKKITLDYLISVFSDLPLHKIDGKVLALLELGVFQIFYAEKIPLHAAVNETVALAGAIPGAGGFVNAVLRNAAARKNERDALLDLPGKKGMSVRYGYPKHLVSLWCENYGVDRTIAIMEAQNAPGAFSLRCNTLKTAFEAWEEKLAASHLPFHRNPLAKNCVTVEEAIVPDEIPGFSEGECFVQDAAAGHAVDLLAIRPGDRVLDLCAAPGGKTFAAACDLEGQGEIIASDLHENRLHLLEAGLRRLGIRGVKTAVCDAAVDLPAPEKTFDKIILDAPCSGYGVISKKPDLRYKSREETKSLPALQSAILENAARALKRGGTILYATCTLNKAENEDVTDHFLKNHPNFHRKRPPETIFPEKCEHDGFFADLLEEEL